MEYLALTINGTPIEAPTQIPNGGTGILNAVMSNALTIFLIFAALFAGFVFIRGGIEWISSGGDKQKIEQARQRLVYGILGLILVLLSFFVVNFVFKLFSLDPL